MAINSIVRVSFQSNVHANQSANNALVGHTQNSTGSGPYERVGTAVYSCCGATELSVAQALAGLGQTLSTYAADMDFVSITVVRTS